ncbi:MAG: hypothetical protein QM770_03740 [Tepidisphaeraceae bacterium]
MSNSVFDEMICPDCGGKIGGTGADGYKPCKCFAAAKPKTVDEIPLAPSAPEMNEAKKVCRVCGKDLTGRSRLKDDRGYLCKPCADKEDEKEADLIKCPECERRLKPDAFVTYRGTMICRKCNAYHMEHDKVKVGKVELTHHAEHEKQKIKTLLILLGVLGVLILIGLAKMLFR